MSNDIKMEVSISGKPVSMGQLRAVLESNRVPDSAIVNITKGQTGYDQRDNSSWAYPDKITITWNESLDVPVAKRVY